MWFTVPLAQSISIDAFSRQTTCWTRLVLLAIDLQIVLNCGYYTFNLYFIDSTLANNQNDNWKPLLNGIERMNVQCALRKDCYQAHIESSHIHRNKRVKVQPVFLKLSSKLHDFNCLPFFFLSIILHLLHGIYFFFWKATWHRLTFLKASICLSYTNTCDFPFNWPLLFACKIRKKNSLNRFI